MTPPDMPLARKFEMEEYVGALAGSVDFESGHPAPESEQKQVVKVKGQGRPKLLGLIYIETDRRLLSPHAASELGDTPPYPSRWTHPLAEIAYLRSLIEAELSSRIPPTPRLLGLVPWAPIDEGPAALEKYMRLARESAGEATWARIVGWRFLVQGLRLEGAFDEVVGSQKWIEGLQRPGAEGRTWRRSDVRGRAGEEKRKGFTFDVGVDQHGAGTWQLEGFAGCIEKLRALEDENSDRDVEQVARTIFVLSKSSCLVLFPHLHDLGNESFTISLSSQIPTILGHICSARQVGIGNQNPAHHAPDHFCKPDFHSSSSSSTSFEAWYAALARLAAQPYVYLKLSGFFTEVESPLLNTSTGTPTATFNVVFRYVKAAFKLFGARRIMFGSDWPVCGVGSGTNFGHFTKTERAEEGKGEEGGEQVNGADRERGRGKSAWTEWHDVVERLLDACELDEEEKEWVWWRTAAEAYGVEVDVDVGGGGDA